MVINSHRHCFLRIFLTYHILVQLRFDLVRSRNIFDIDLWRFFWFILFLFDLLVLRNLVLQV